jgi:hypothetical protein
MVNGETNQETSRFAAPFAATDGVVAAPGFQSLINPDWPEAEWDVSGAFVFDFMFLQFNTFLLKNTGLRLLRQVHGAPVCHWNGGRFNPAVFDQDKIDPLIRSYSDSGIAVRATFTNYNITRESLSDSLGNLVLDALHRHNRTGRNGVIVCEEILREHVRARYPELTVVASVTKIAKESGGGDLAYYRSLESNYDQIMIHPDDNLRPELIGQLENKEKYEILVNEPCISNCKLRRHHYQLLSDCHTHFLDYSRIRKVAEHMQSSSCTNIHRLPPDSGKRSLILHSAELKRLYDLGFRKFKLQGRGMRSDQGLLFEFARWFFTHDPAYDYITPRLLLAFMSPAP